MAQAKMKSKVHKYEKDSIFQKDRKMGTRVAPASSASEVAKPSTKVKIKFDIERCKGCALCVDACPRTNIRMSEKLNQKGHRYAQIIDEEKCTGCGLCYQMCPDLAIEIE